MIQRVKGTQDFIDMRLFNFVISQIQKHLQEYNFTQISTPILEHTELFKRTLGLHTDVVSKEMFLIENKSASDPEDSICLRPEATASTVRAFLENGITELPWKVFISGPMFRYERPQKGRFRQFHQTNLEIIGSKSINQDALLIRMLDRLFKDKFLLDNYAILINFLGCYEDRNKFNQELKKFLEQITDKLCQNCLERKDKNPLRIFDCKNPSCKEIYLKAPKTIEHLCKDCDAEWKQLQTTLELTSVSFAHSSNLVRGLDYYDKTVFEFSSADLGAQNAFCGGGRYDRLVSEISQEKYNQPAVGAAIGIERLLLLVEMFQNKLPIPELPSLYLIIPLSKDQQLLALLLANQLSSNNITHDILFDDVSVKSLMRKANKMGAKFCLILGSQEQENHEVTVKDMTLGTEQKIKQINLVDLIKKKAF